MAEVPFESHAPYDYAWTLAAFDAIKAGTLHRSSVPVGKALLAKVTGLCPRCAHPIDWSMVMDASVGAGGVLGVERRTESRVVSCDVVCGCPETHEGAPPQVKGCGIGFRVEIKAERDG